MTVMSWLYEQWFGLHAKFQAATGPQLSRASRENQGPEVREDSLPVSSQQCLMWWPLQAAGRGLHVTGSGREACGCLDGCGAQNKGGHSLGDCRGELWALSLEPLITRTAAQGPHGTFLLTSVADQGSRVGLSGRGLSVPWGDTVFQKSHHDLWWARGSPVRASECGCITAVLGLLEQSGCVLSVHGACTATRVPRWDGQGSTGGGDSSQAPRPPVGLAATCLLQTFNFSESPDLPFIQVCPIAGWDGSVITFLLIPTHR